MSRLRIATCFIFIAIFALMLPCASSVQAADPGQADQGAAFSVPSWQYVKCAYTWKAVGGGETFCFLQTHNQWLRVNDNEAEQMLITATATNRTLYIYFTALSGGWLYANQMYLLSW
jgi:hypothetical protein